MIARQRLLGFMAALALTLALVLGPGFTGTAGAASEDVAMFYDDLSQYGQWVEDGKYGPVWRPNQVAEDWRPYTNGRWVPTDDGNVFESEEPWGWATYHYGNWMPTEANGWVWVPGRTWYPSTVEWRTSPESEPVDTSYVGWAPTPPPNYVPPPDYAPSSYYQGSPGDRFADLAPLDFRQGGQFPVGFRAAVYAGLFLYELRVSDAPGLCAGILSPDACIIRLTPPRPITRRLFSAAGDSAPATITWAPRRSTSPGSPTSTGRTLTGLSSATPPTSPGFTVWCRPAG